MPLVIKDLALVEDCWEIVSDPDEAEARAGTDALLAVPLPVWLAWQQENRRPFGATGVWLQADDAFEELVPYLAQLPLIAVHFASFTDGRGYSVARLLRERYGYRGELRAIGDVLRDQLYFLHRCGFNAFALRSDQSAEAALRAFDDYSVSYQ